MESYAASMGVYQVRNSSVALSRYQRFAKVAFELAAASDHKGDHKLCALVVWKNEVLSVGYNQHKTHPISADTKLQQLHAEMHALLRCPDPEGADVIVVRAKASGRPGLARPCAVCEGILRRSGVRRVLYTIDCDDPDDPQLEEMKL